MGEKPHGSTIGAINQMAKHYRDLEKSYGVNTAEGQKYKELKNKYYAEKDKLLSQFDPVLIHRQSRVKEFILSVSEDKNWYEDINSDDVINEGVFRDKNSGKVLKFKKIKVVKNLKSYSLYYNIDDYRFHMPVAQDLYDKMKNEFIEVNEIELEKKYNVKIKDLLD